jgi:multiple antibiotic resistance protein
VDCVTLQKNKTLIELLRDTLANTISIFTIMNPLSAGVVMLTLLDDGVTKKEIRSIATRNTKAVFIAMLVLFLGGNIIFDFFGISPHGLRVFGGIILLVMGFNMVQGHGKKVNHNAKDQSAALERDDISTVPLAIPIIVGPGMATTLISLSVNAAGWQEYVSGVAAIVVCCIASLLILQRMPYIKRKLGTNGLKVFNRLMGLIVGSLAAQMILKGVMGLYALFNV